MSKSSEKQASAADKSTAQTVSVESKDDKSKKGDLFKKEVTKELDGDPNQPKTMAEIWKAWPKITLLIVVNEFCERFSYYGLRAVLTVYLINIVGFAEDDASQTVQMFQMLAYATAVLGAIIADGFFGRYWTIATVSMVYASGQLILTFASWHGRTDGMHPYMDVLALIVIGFGTGGIKPCVSSFGADQFNPDYKKMLSMFFSVFYFSINAGSLISSCVTPDIRTRSCFGSTTCYPGAFGLPALLMILATVAFLLGSKHYKMSPMHDNVVLRVFKIFFISLKNYLSASKRMKNVFDHACDHHQCDKDKTCVRLRESDPGQCQQKIVAEDCKGVVRILVMLTPIPFFWACFEQQGTRWVVQGIGCELSTGFSLIPQVLPDQMIVFNAALILVFIPLSQAVVYPLLNKIFKLTVFRKVGIGLFLCALSFVCSATIQLSIHKYEIDLPNDNTALLSIANTMDDCNVNVEIDGKKATVKANSSLIQNKATDTFEWLELNGGGLKKANLKFACNSTSTTEISFNVTAGKVNVLTLMKFSWTIDTSTVKKSKEAKGYTTLQVVSTIQCLKAHQEGCHNNSAYVGDLALCAYGSACDPNDIKGNFYRIEKKDVIPKMTYEKNSKPCNATIYKYDKEGKMVLLDVKPQKYQVYYWRKGNKPEEIEYAIVNIEGMGAVQTLNLEPSNVPSTRGLYTAKASLNTIVPFNKVSILWQVPQFVIITAAEIMVSISLVEFAYTEASPRLKAFMAACSYMMVALGNIIIILMVSLIGKLKFNLAIEMYLFAALAFGACGLWTLLSLCFYKTKPEGEKGGNEKDKPPSGPATTQPTATGSGAATATATPADKNKPSDSKKAVDKTPDIMKITGISDTNSDRKSTRSIPDDISVSMRSVRSSKDNSDVSPRVEPSAAASTASVAPKVAAAIATPPTLPATTTSTTPLAHVSVPIDSLMMPAVIEKLEKHAAATAAVTPSAAPSATPSATSSATPSATPDAAPDAATPAANSTTNPSTTAPEDAAAPAPGQL